MRNNRVALRNRTNEGAKPAVARIDLRGPADDSLLPSRTASLNSSTGFANTLPSGSPPPISHSTPMALKRRGQRLTPSDWSPVLNLNASPGNAPPTPEAPPVEMSPTPASAPTSRTSSPAPSIYGDQRNFTRRNSRSSSSRTPVRRTGAHDPFPKPRTTPKAQQQVNPTSPLLTVQEVSLLSAEKTTTRDIRIAPSASPVDSRAMPDVSPEISIRPAGRVAAQARVSLGGGDTSSDDDHLVDDATPTPRGKLYQLGGDAVDIETPVAALGDTTGSISIRSDPSPRPMDRHEHEHQPTGAKSHSYREEAAALDAHVERLEGEVEAAHKCINGLQSELHAAQRHAAETTVALTDVTAESKEVQQLLKKERQRVAVAEDKLENTMERLRDAEAGQKSAAATESALDDATEALREERCRREDAEAAIDGLVRARDAALRGEKEALEAAEEANRHRDEAQSVIREERDAALRLVEELRASLSAERAKSAESQDLIDELRASVDNAEADKDSIRKEVAAASAHRKALVSEMVSLKASLAQHRAVMDRMGLPKNLQTFPPELLEAAATRFIKNSVPVHPKESNSAAPNNVTRLGKQIPPPPSHQPPAADQQHQQRGPAPVAVPQKRNAQPQPLPIPKTPITPAASAQSTPSLPPPIVTPDSGSVPKSAGVQRLDMGSGNAPPPPQRRPGGRLAPGPAIDRHRRSQ